MKSKLFLIGFITFVFNIAQAFSLENLIGSYSDTENPYITLEISMSSTCPGIQATFFNSYYNPVWSDEKIYCLGSSNQSFNDLYVDTTVFTSHKTKISLTDSGLYLKTESVVPAGKRYFRPFYDKVTTQEIYSLQEDLLTIRFQQHWNDSEKKVHNKRVFIKH